MNKNLGTTDKIIRIIIGIACIGVIASGAVQGVLTIVLGVLAAIMILTALINFCPLYWLGKISTYKNG
ncbi:MAG: DUF2892 domain-containing protein [Gammaproteobacteria bacterium]|nr:DUF2892 domain-containing protein [Gammaproteobacteria bacterium]